MSLEEFHCIILGDEPAGLWLASELARVAKAAGKPMRLGWISFTNECAPVCVPVAWARALALQTGPAWSARIVTPSRSLTWSRERLLAEFPELPAKLMDEESRPGVTKKMGGREVSAVRYALRSRPELLAFAGGLWKFVGRARTLSPENLLATALGLTELAWWRPWESLPGEVTRFSLSADANPIEAIEPLTYGGTQVTFVGSAPMLARHWIVNLPWHRIQALGRKNGRLPRALGGMDPRSGMALGAYSLFLDEKKVPCTLGPLSLLYDTDDIPDPDGEIWPVTLGGTALTLWASVRRELSLDDALDRFGRGMGTVNRHFPFLYKAVRSAAVPLSMETCHGDAWRQRALSCLEASVSERYDVTALRTETKVAGLHALSPAHGCSLPYPFGPLGAARRLLIDIAGRKTLKEVKARLDAQ